jgi:hypothetical protein
MALDPTSREGVMGLGDNPQMPTLSSLEPDDEPARKDEYLLKYSEIPSWTEMTGGPHFKIGIVISSSATTDQHIISAISKPASSCSLTSLVVLHPQENENKPEVMHKWLENNNLRERVEDVTVGWGQEGFNELLESQIDAVYIILPPG